MRWTYLSLLILLITAPANSVSWPEPDWRPTGGPDGLDAYDVVDAADGTVILATADGVWRRPIGETRWARSGLEGLLVRAVGRSADESLFAVGFELYHFYPRWPRMYRSTDAGMTWLEVNEGLSSTARWVLDLERGPGGAMLAAGEAGVFRFNAATAIWEQYSPPIYATSVTTDGIRVYASSMTHVYRTTNFGATWTETFVVGDVGINALAAGDNGLVVVVAELTDYWLADDGVVFISTDYGESFRLADGEFGSDGSIGFAFAYDTEVLADSTILVGGFRFLSAGRGSGLKASTDLGETWTSIGNDRLDVWRVEQLGNDRIWVAGYHNVMVSNNNTWERAVEGLGGADVLSLATTPSGIVAGGFITGVSVLDPIDSEWRWLGPDIESAYDVDSMPNGDVVAVLRDFGSLRWSPDRGWESFGPEESDSARLAVDPAGTVCVGGWHGCSCSDAGFGDWITTAFDHYAFTAMTAMSEGAFAAANFDLLTNEGWVSHTIDNGQTWETTLVTPTPVRDLIWDRFGNLWAIQESGRVSLSHDLGHSWEHRGDAGSDVAWSSLAADQLGRLYAGSLDGSLLASSDGGFSWRSVDNGLPDEGINALETHDGFLYAAVMKLGVWATPVATMVRGGGSDGRRVQPILDAAIRVP